MARTPNRLPNYSTAITPVSVTTNTLIVTGNARFNDNAECYFGSSNDAFISWNTAQTVDAWYHGTATGQNTVIFAEASDAAFDFAHGAATNPTIFVHSANQSTTEWVSLTHDQSNGILQAGSGNLHLTANSGIVAIPNTTGSGNPRVLIRSGAGLNSSIEFNETNSAVTTLKMDGVNDQGILAVGSLAGRQFILTDIASVAQDHDHAVTTNPTLFVHSATTPNVSNNEWGSFAHNQTDLVITTGANTGAGTAPTTIDNGISFQPRGTEYMRLSGTGGFALTSTITAVSTTGNQTINKPCGRVNIAAGGTTITVTNSLVTANSIVLAVAATNDATARVTNVVAAAGSFTINTVAVTAETAFNFFVVG